MTQNPKQEASQVTIKPGDAFVAGLKEFRRHAGKRVEGPAWAAWLVGLGGLVAGLTVSGQLRGTAALVGAVLAAALVMLGLVVLRRKVTA